MNRTSSILVAGLLALGVGCGGGGGAEPTAKSPTSGGGTGRKGVDGTVVADAAANKFTAALDSFTSHDKANDWSDPVCNQVAKAFEDAADAQPNKRFPEATYNAGLAYQRCNKDKDAESRFQKALSDEPKFHYARAQLALYKFKADNNVDGAITSLEQAVSDANFQNVPALVNLAMFQMIRDSQTVGQNCTTKGKGGADVQLQDFECAKLNLQRALAIDDGYMPAFNQLALYYFNGAKKRAASGKSVSGRFGRQIATNAAMGKRADNQQLELAALVCSQAIRKNAKYAPIHNTAGLILNELGQINGAVNEFQTASGLDASFFEAHMNVGAVNLSFRGFDKAQAAYQKAIQMRPNDYDAHLGLALALRGQIDDTNYDKQVAAVQSELDAAKKIDGARPDAYFNEGILTQEYKAKSGGDNAKVIAVYNQAKGLFTDFISKASGKGEYDGAVKKAKERLQDIDDTITFLQAGGPAPAPAAPQGGAGAAAPAPGAGANGTGTGNAPPVAAPAK